MSLRDSEERERESARLGFKDYVALSIAALETFLLPLVIIAIVLVVLAVIFRARL